MEYGGISLKVSAALRRTLLSSEQTQQSDFIVTMAPALRIEFIGTETETERPRQEAEVITQVL